MKDNYASRFKALTFCCLFTIFSFHVSAQVGIGTTNPNPNALLDLDASTTPGGLLLPRVNLTGTTSFAPMTANVAGMVVYNTATAGIAPNNVTPGYYYNDGGQWVRVADASMASSDWKLAGNASTTPGTGAGENYLGTTDAQALIIGTQGAQRMRLLANGQVVINDTGAPFASDRLTVQGANTEFAINGYTSNSTAVYGENNAGAGNGVYGNSTNVGVRGFGGNGALLESGLNGGYGVVAWNTAATGTTRTGLLAIGQNLGVLSTVNTGAILYGSQTGASAFANDPAGTGLAAGGNALLGTITLNAGSGLSGLGTLVGVFGYASSAVNNFPQNGVKAGGYFANADGGFAYVGAWADPPAVGNQADIAYKILGSGVVSTIVKDVNEIPITMFAPEAPEILFQDYGIGKLRNGSVIIQLDPNLSKNIRVDDSHPMKVFVQLEGDCNGVYVTSKSANSFTVKELQGGRSNVSFSWSIVATRADEILYNNKGVGKTSYNGQRFPLAPKALEITENEAVKISAESVNNQIMSSPRLDSKKKAAASQSATISSDKVGAASPTVEKVN